MKTTRGSWKHKKEEWKYTITNWPDAVIPAWIILSSLFLTVLLVVCTVSLCIVLAIILVGSYTRTCGKWQYTLRFASTQRVCVCVMGNHCDTMRFNSSVHTLVEYAANAHDAHRHTPINWRNGEQPWKEGETTNTKQKLIFCAQQRPLTQPRQRRHSNENFVQGTGATAKRNNKNLPSFLYQTYEGRYIIVSIFSLLICFVRTFGRSFVRSFTRSLHCARVSRLTLKQHSHGRSVWSAFRCMQFIFEHQI